MEQDVAKGTHGTGEAAQLRDLNMGESASVSALE